VAQPMKGKAQQKDRWGQFEEHCEID